MRSSFLSLLVLLLNKSCFGITLSIGPSENTENQHFFGKTTFTNLNEDCLYLIFDLLDLNDLINIAQINPKFAYITKYIFHRKYSDYEIQIINTKCEWNDKACHVNGKFKSIIIGDFKTALNIMKYFGKPHENHIHNLTIWNNPKRNYTSGSDWAMINRIVNEYGSEFLTELNLGVISKELWPQLTIPFKTVKTLHFEIQVDTDGMKLNQLFPNLRELQIRLTSDSNYDFIDCELPRLEHLDILWYGNQKDQTIGMIKKNPQIRSVIVKYATSEFRKVISEHLPKLENLTLTFDDDQDEPLHFENVKHCVLHTKPGSTIKNLTFPHLESFETPYFHREFEKFTEFFQRHRNVTRLKLLSLRNSAFKLDVLTAALDNLEEMIVTYYLEINIDNVIKFIEIHPKLKKFRFKTYEIGEADREELCKRFEQDWNIKSIADNRDSFLFEKKSEL